MYQQQLKSKFEQEYQRLNEQQRVAVDTVEGPVMVIAGPGTGKTQILAARIGKILLETDAQPENILCLTYTDAGAIAMRKRLQQFIGAAAYKVNLYTFHAFCNDVIQDNLSLFEKNSLDAVSDLERIQLFKKLIDDFPKLHPLKRYRGDVYFEINNLQHLFSTMKKEGWKADFINQKIDEYIKDLPTRDEYVAKRATKDFKKGDVRIDKIAEENEKMEKLRAAVNEFDNFQYLMRQRNRYDFDDMINWVIRAFEENKSLLASYQEKFQYILVDEYQDTSGTQNKIVQLLINYWDVPNVFVVGDDDQSIFRFQGANVQNMLDFASGYQRDLVTVVLTNNYRSTQPILNIAKSVIDKNEERLVKQMPGLTKELIASNLLIRQLEDPPLINEYLSQRDEMIAITESIAVLTKEPDAVAPGRIAVIYKENKYGEELAQYLRLKNIPVYSKRSINILADPFINKLITILRYINAELDIPYAGDELLFEILHYDFYKVSPIEIAKITVEVNTKRYGGEKMSIRRSIADKAAAPAKDLFDAGLNNSLKNCGAILERLIGEAKNVTIQQLFEYLIQYGGVLQYIMQSDDKIRLMKLLTAFFDFIKDESSRDPLMNLNDLIAVIELMQKEELKVSMVEIGGTDKGVNLLTAHGSKGLEFEYVFFVGCNASSWEKKRKPGGGYRLPDTIFSSVNTHDDKTSAEEELRRLFYVALTRAEKFLYISYAKFKIDGKELEPSMFIAEILQQQSLPIQTVIVEEAAKTDFAALEFLPQAPEIETAEEDFISNLLEKFVMNVTALNNYLKCPLEFYYKNLIRIPTGRSEATEFGSAVHHALQRLFEKMRDNNNIFGSKQDVIGDFSWYMQRNREHFTKEAFARRMEYGEEVLGNYYDKYVHQFNRIVAVERNIKNILSNGIPIKGKLDKLEFDGKAVNVVDYKTGDIDKAMPQLKGPHEKEPNGGNYWRQAVFYKILVDNYDQKDWNVVSTEFDFIEPDKKKEYRKEKITIQPQDIETVKQQITQTWTSIQARDFYTGCGKEDCHWCNFVKENKLAVALHDIEEEED